MSSPAPVAPLVYVPDPVLVRPAKQVLRIDKKVLRIIETMTRTLLRAKNPSGVGLAAPQIGISLRIFLMKPTPDAPVSVFLNPEILWSSPDHAKIQRPVASSLSQKDDHKLEGCLSIPNVWGILERPTRVRLRFMDHTGRVQEKEFSGFPATIVQHETDHVNGILFTQRVLEQNEKLYRIERTPDGEESLVALHL